MWEVEEVESNVRNRLRSVRASQRPSSSPLLLLEMPTSPHAPPTAPSPSFNLLRQTQRKKPLEAWRKSLGSAGGCRARHTRSWGSQSSVRAEAGTARRTTSKSKPARFLSCSRSVLSISALYSCLYADRTAPHNLDDQSVQQAQALHTSPHPPSTSPPIPHQLFLGIYPRRVKHRTTNGGLEGTRKGRSDVKRATFNVRREQGRHRRRAEEGHPSVTRHCFTSLRHSPIHPRCAAGRTTWTRQPSTIVSVRSPFFLPFPFLSPKGPNPKTTQVTTRATKLAMTFIGSE